MQPDVGKGAKNMFLHRNKPLFLDIRYYRHLLELSTKDQTPCKELVTGWPHCIVVKDASIHGIGLIIISNEKSCIPTVFRLAWPDCVQEFFRKGNIKIRIWEWQEY